MGENERSWCEKLAEKTYGISADTTIKKGECREYVDYWLRLEKIVNDPEISLDRGRDIHIPDPRVEDSESPICNTRGDEVEGIEWVRKELTVFPPPWDEDKLCDKCAAILQGEDYLESRGADDH